MGQQSAVNGSPYDADTQQPSKLFCYTPRHSSERGVLTYVGPDYSSQCCYVSAGNPYEEHSPAS